MRFLFGLLGVLYSVSLVSPAWATLTLSNPSTGTQFIIDPDTLAVDAHLANDRQLIISSSLISDRVAGIKATGIKDTGKSIQWQRDHVQIEVRLDGDALVMRFGRNTPGDIVWPQVPAAAKALILPLFEGSYIPTSNAQWRKALEQEYQGINTTQDLSIPAMGFDYSDHVVSIVYANPFNNTIDFKAAEQGIAVTTRHSFTRLDQQRLFEVRINIDAQDFLAPAKHYRRWLQQQGKFVSLKNKLAAAPDGQALIGASHVYVWGERSLTPYDVKDWKLLQQLIPNAWATQGEIRQAIQAKDIAQNNYLRGLLVQTINQYLEQELPGYSLEIFQQRREKIIRMFGRALNPTESWGDLSPALIAQMQNAGLKKLWLGLPQWTAGFANPNAIKAARMAGYLIGPYDSYDTALPEGNNNPSWLSAQLGQHTFLTCGILLENGKRKTGFNNEGVYTNPVCVKPILEKRVQQLQNTLQFNSWFLDVDATGMLFDDYDPTRLTSQAQDAKNRIDGMAWIAKKFGIIVGSEDGHGVANSSIAFAHGMQVRGFGWRDQDMRKNASSPFYLGKWFPAHQPDFFFKTASIKPEYQELYFNPAHRLPLFQAAFHDSVITTNHWTLDNLKFKETRQSTELLQQLYNVPPMLNISLDSAQTRLQYLKRIDNFFRPLHARLYDQALVDFKYLARDGLLQQTTFADGTLIVANFGEHDVPWNGKSIKSKSLIAVLPDGKVLDFDTSLQKASSQLNGAGPGK